MGEQARGLSNTTSGLAQTNDGALLNKSALLNKIIETAHDHLFVVDAEGRILDVSPGCSAVYGMSREALMASNVNQLVAQGVLSPSISQQVLKTQQPCQMMQITGTGRRVLAEAYPVFVDGRLDCVVSRSMDLTDLQLMQDEYALLQKRISDQLKRGPDAGLSEELALDELEIRSRAMREMAGLLRRVAPTDATVMILGESGVGKTAFARQLHQWSRREAGPFIDVNCAAIPDNLFESEMFGYQPGAFSGAARGGKAGMLEMADGGTLFLDEIAELPLTLQSKLLKVIQDGQVTRLGDTQPRQVNFRLVVATHQDLAQAVEAGRFRLDLFYRINVLPVTLPPLRQRREDIPGLVNLQLARLNERYGHNRVIHPSLWNELMSHDWPGNVRELENWLERAWLTSMGDVIGAPGQTSAETYAPVTPRGSEAMVEAEPVEGDSLKDMLERYESQVLAQLCETANSTYALAKRLNISQPSVVRKLRKYHLCCGGRQRRMTAGSSIKA